MLQHLPHLSSIALGISSCPGSEIHDNYPVVDWWEQYVTLPPLGGVPALTHLRLAGMVNLPPDFHQLSSLQQLVMNECLPEDDRRFIWDSNVPLTGLTSLTQVEIIPPYSTEELPGAMHGASCNAAAVAIAAILNQDYLVHLVYTALPVTDPGLLASVPHLAVVHAPHPRGARQAQRAEQAQLAAAWRAQLAALRPDVRITPPPPPAAGQQ